MIKEEAKKSDLVSINILDFTDKFEDNFLSKKYKDLTAHVRIEKHVQFLLLSLYLYFL